MNYEKTDNRTSDSAVVYNTERMHSDRRKRCSFQHINAKHQQRISHCTAGKHCNHNDSTVRQRS